MTFVQTLGTKDLEQLIECWIKKKVTSKWQETLQLSYSSLRLPPHWRDSGLEDSHLHFQGGTLVTAGFQGKRADLILQDLWGCLDPFVAYLKDRGKVLAFALPKTELFQAEK